MSQSHHIPMASNLVARVLIALVLLIGIYFFHQFLVPVLGALIIVFASWRLYEKLLIRCRGKTWLAATLSTLLVVLVIILPLIALISSALQELREGLNWLYASNQVGVPAPLWVERLPLVGSELAPLWNEYLNHPQAISELSQLVGLGQLANISRVILSFGRQIFAAALGVVFMVITLFFLYKDGFSLVQQIDKVGERVMPERWYRFSRVAPTMVSATITGMTSIAIGEGIVLGCAYAIAGAPSPVTLGVITGFMALIPGGAPLSMSIVSLYLVGSGHSTAGLLLFLWGCLELFVVDKTIRPRLVGGPAKLPFLPTLFGLVGGVETMGLVGLFIGPVIMAFLVTLWREWVSYSEETTLSTP
ncbi:MAG: AI-2E family transporter [Burkholderiales bacterium]|jgi:predicted PurR-regulated permease PerM|nr:AI-2E family transporter [Burkholderiales bacterium]